VNDIVEEPDDAATPLAPDEKKALKPAHIATRGDLNRKIFCAAKTGRSAAAAAAS
jgi:hypothetical protein